MTVGHRKGWDAGSKELSNPEGCMQGFRLRGSDNISYHIADIMRNIEAGFRGFLVYDEGILFIPEQNCAGEGLIPAETIFKFSVFGGCCSAAGAKLVASMGANSMNPSSDVSLPILGGIRQAVDIPLDVYMIIVDAFGGMFRAYEGPEIARLAAPCYFKFEPGTSEGDIYKTLGHRRLSRKPYPAESQNRSDRSGNHGQTRSGAENVRFQGGRSGYAGRFKLLL